MAPEILDPEHFGLPHVRHSPASNVHSFAMCCWTVSLRIPLLAFKTRSNKRLDLRSAKSVPRLFSSSNVTVHLGESTPCSSPMRQCNPIVDMADHGHVLGILPPGSTNFLGGQEPTATVRSLDYPFKSAKLICPLTIVVFLHDPIFLNRVITKSTHNTLQGSACPKRFAAHRHPRTATGSTP